MRKRRLQLALAVVAFAALGLPDGVHGVAWPDMRRTFDLPLSGLGAILLSSTVGYLAFALAGGRLTARLGTGRLVVAAATSAACGFALYVVSPWWPLVLVGATLAGLSAGAVDVGLNAELALHHGTRAMGLLHASFGIGATTGPLVAAAVVTSDRSWRLAFVPIVVLQLSIAAAGVLLRDRWGTTARTAPATPTHELPPPRTLLVASIALFYVYTGLEVGIGQWTYTLLTDGRALGETTAGVWVATYWGALTVGRVALGLVGDRVAPERLLALSGVGATTGIVLLWVDPAGLGVLGLPVAGLSLASIFPVLVTLTPARLGAHRTAWAIGLQLAAAGFGASTIPAMEGVIADATDVDVFAPLFVVVAVALVSLQALTARTARRAAGAPR